MLPPKAVGPVYERVSQPGMLDVIIGNDTLLIAPNRERYTLYTESSIS